MFGNKIREPTIIDMYRIYIKYIKDENELLHQRTTWFLAVQGLLAAGAGYVFKDYFNDFWYSIIQSSSLPNERIVEASIMWWVCALIGIFSSQDAYISITAALNAQDTIEKLWIQAFTEQERRYFPDMMGGKKCPDAKNGGRLAKSISEKTKIGWCILAAMPFIALLASILI